MKEEKDILLDHNYDGIQELDNDLPPWWLYMFYITIIWGVLYLIYYHVSGIGPSSYEEYMTDMNPGWQAVEVQGETFMEKLGSYSSPYSIESVDLTPRLRDELLAAEKKLAEMRSAEEQLTGSVAGLEFEDLIKAAMKKADAASLDKLKASFPEIWVLAEAEMSGAPAEAVAEAEPEIQMAALTDAASLQSGEQIYQTNCATCHGKTGEGGIGPNMTDDYWIHGAGMGNMVKVIKNGVPAKGMIAWAKILRPQQIQEVASFMLTLHGTNPPNGKAPQGEKVEYPLSE